MRTLVAGLIVATRRVSRRVAALAAAAVTGCILVMLAPAPVYSHKPVTTSILFKNEIAQIFQRKCLQCHTEDNLAMPLTTYTAARPWARAIREEVLDRKMPPWPAVPGYGQFSNDISLNMREKEIILAWADGGAPSGVPRAEESIPPVYVPPAPAWEFGEPDVVLPIGQHAVASGAAFQIARFVVPTRLPRERRVRAIALKQGDRRVVRHAAFYDDATGRWLGGWTPWQTLSALAAGTVLRLPANARIAVEIGYAGTDADVVDRSELGLYFEEGGAALADALRLTSAPRSVPAKASGERVRTETVLPAAADLLAFWLEPGTGAASVELTAVTPDGLLTPLLWINEYRAEWRSPFYLARPVTLPRGARLVMTTYYDNPADGELTVRPAMWIVTAASSRAAAPRK